MRKILIAIVAAVAVAASLSANPAAAQAATCAEWRPSDTVIYQSNGWKVDLYYSNYHYRWRAHARAPSGMTNFTGNVKFFSYNPSSVSFVITWETSYASAGRYVGKIDPWGFVSGHTVDQWNRYSGATWQMRDLAHCHRYY